MEPPLRDYARKRDFRRTPEPSGGSAVAPGLRYVVQKHDARRLHYDLRLELDGVLKSWAVPKGPSYDPEEKRLAVHVEDHPLEYADFEGVIPRGEYGAGTVMVWDYGTWEPVGDPQRGYRTGRLHFRLHGARLHGEWVLARMGGKAAGEDKENWLLLKITERGVTHATDNSSDASAVSVLSGRTLEQIATAPEFIWSEEGKQRLGPKPASAAPRRKRRIGAPLPESIEPQLAALVEAPPRDPGWLYEIKFDGYRTLCRVQQGKVSLVSRNGQDWTARFGALARAVRALPVRDAWLDGEVAVLLPDGRSSFSALQLALSEQRDGELVYFLFDLLYRDGADLRALPLHERKAALADLLSAAPAGSPLRLADHLQGDGAAVFEEACRLGLEGLVAKRADGAWHPGRARDWQKVKCLQRQEFVVGGYSAPRGTREGFGALLVGVYEGERFVFAGRVGTGFDERTLRDLYARLAPLATTASPFDTPVPSATRAEQRRFTWVRPETVIEVAFAEWTRDNILRQAVFQGVREDKPAREVRREQPPPQASAPAPASDDDRVAGLRLSHPEKILYPQLGLTKRDLARYYEAIGEHLLPDLVGRPLTLLRCPEGRHMPCFYQKHAAEGLPAGISRIPIAEKEGQGIYLAVDNLAGVIGLVQMGVLEIHTWGAHADKPDSPDRLILDLDPDEGLPWQAVIEGARIARELITTLGLHPFLRTTGGKGLHVVVPLQRRHNWDEVKDFAHALARAMVHHAPRAFTSNPAKRARAGKLYIDYLRNARGATAIANFSTRARPGAPVAVPLQWDELGTPSDAWRVDNVRQRLAALTRDPWDGYGASARAITKAMKQALGLM